MSRAGVRGALGLVTHHKSVATVTAEQRCMRGRSDMEIAGSMLREMHGPTRGVRRRMMQSWEMC